jgi:MFS family permease
MGSVNTESTPSQPRSTRAPSPPGRDPRRPWVPSPFTRLARAHSASVAGDALFAIGLAGSVFFSLDFTAARWRVALYLILTIAPFAIAAPLIGPVLDRIKGGRRWIIVGSLAIRAILAFFVVRHMNSLLFYPEAFGMLIMQKVYSISKSAVIPGTVHSDEELVQANSKLTVLSSIAVVVVAVPGGILLKLGGGAWSVGLGGIIFAIGTVLALQMQPTTIAIAPAGELEQEELRSAGITHASAAMGLIRGIVGFLSFMLAFDFKSSGLPLWQLGFVAATAQFGFFIGAVIAPRLRTHLVEERILIGSLLLMMVGGVLTAFIGGLAGAALLSMIVGATGSTAKQAFDSIVQRDAPDANRGRSFAKFETRFQLIWVIGALLPIIIPIPAAIGFGLIAIVAAVAVTTYLVGLRNVRHGRLPVPRRGVLRRPVVIDERHPSARPEADSTRVTDLGFAVPDPTIVGGPPSSGEPIDPTVAGGAVPLDSARRWMQGPPPPPVPRDRSADPVAEPPSELPAQPPTEIVDDNMTDDARSTSEPDVGLHSDSSDPSVPAHRRSGAIFGPDAWDDPSTPPTDQIR